MISTSKFSFFLIYFKLCFILLFICLNVFCQFEESYEDNENYNENSHGHSQLSPEKLKGLFSIIDKDKDGYIDGDEIKDHFILLNNKHYENLSNEKWKYFEKSIQNGQISWEEFSTKSKYKDVALFKRDQRRFLLADFDKNGFLNKTEFHSFLVPDIDPKMQEVLVKEMLELFDTDNDGFISEEEFKSESAKYENHAEGHDADWLKREQLRFKNEIDLNKDGKLDENEIHKWISPKYEDYAEKSAFYILQMSDHDKDGLLSESEFLPNAHYFANDLTSNENEEDLNNSADDSEFHEEL